ncbi:MAG: cytochrome c [Betaproteobacteria bacterium]
MTYAQACTAWPATLLVMSVLLALGSGAASAAGDVKAGRMRAVMCQACHGVDGMSKVPDAPNIAGQPEAYLATQLQAFKSGARKNETMAVVVSTLSDKDIDDIAAYFAAIEVRVVKTPGT